MFFKCIVLTVRSIFRITLTPDRHDFLPNFEEGDTVKIKVLTMILILGFTAIVDAQKRSRPKTQITSPTDQLATPQVSPTPEIRRKAVLSMKEGEPVTGLFIKADATSTQIEVAGTLITVPTEKIASIDFTERKPTQLAPEPPSLAIEAAVIYNFGGAQPLARTEIVLLDQSLPQVLRDAGLHGGDLDIEHARASKNRFPNMPDFSRYSTRKPDTDAQLLEDLANALHFPTLGDGQFISKATEAIKAHTAASGTTDFAGKLELRDLKPRQYFVYAVTQTRRGHALWNIPVEIKEGRNSLSIDNTNASIAF